MDRNFKSELTSSIVEGFGKWKRAMDAADTDAGVKAINETEDALVQLFLDTIEKAKPANKLPNEINDGGNTFNNGVSEYNARLKKEIGK